MNTKIRFIGDIHGCFSYYKQLAYNFDGITVQVGDFGLGFGNETPEIEGDNFFIRGNHDNPEICKAHKKYLGDWGYNDGLDMFWVGGADSIDKLIRTEGVDWWRNEELSYAELNTALDVYKKVHPKIMVTHDCPFDIKKAFIRPEYQNDAWTSTQQALQMFWNYEYHKPDIWVFGHYHPRQTKITRIDGTLFVCLPIFGVYDYE